MTIHGSFLPLARFGSDGVSVPRIAIVGRGFSGLMTAIALLRRVRTPFELEQFSTVTQACIAGLGVALMPEFLIRTELETGQLVVAVPHRVKSQSSYYVVTPAARARDPSVAAFVDWIVGEAHAYAEQA